uniref:Uncharacterized protein n=1 Tax=Anguilla anguilla TaxID=7936 RepID=A0A0E9U223_ANGAN
MATSVSGLYLMCSEFKIVVQ